MWAAEQGYTELEVAAWPADSDEHATHIDVASLDPAAATRITDVIVVENCHMPVWHPDGHPGNLAYSPSCGDGSEDPVLGSSEDAAARGSPPHDHGWRRSSREPGPRCPPRHPRPASPCAAWAACNRCGPQDPGVHVTTEPTASEDTVNIWGYCEHCDRWFPCRVERTADWACPSCGTEPLVIKNRALDRDGTGSGDGMPLST